MSFVCISSSRLPSLFFFFRLNLVYYYHHIFVRAFLTMGDHLSDDKTTLVLGIAITTLSLSAIFVTARTLTRSVIKPQFGWDDTLIIVTWVPYLIVCPIVISSANFAVLSSLSTLALVLPCSFQSVMALASISLSWPWGITKRLLKRRSSRNSWLSSHFLQAKLPWHIFYYACSLARSWSGSCEVFQNPQSQMNNILLAYSLWSLK